MVTRRALVVACTAAIAVAVPQPTHASHVWSESRSGSGSGCVLNAPPACSMYVSHAVSGHPAACVGSPGGYTGCWVSQICYASGTSVYTAAATVRCMTGASYCVALEGWCAMSASSFPFVARGTSLTFTASATIVAPNGTTSAFAPSIRVCVDGNGPFPC